MKTRLALCALAICLISTIATGQQVSVNYNHSQSFSQFHTYAWGSDNANKVQNSILAQVALQDIDVALQGKGLQKVQEDQNPDLIVTANGGLKQQTSYSAWGMRGIGGGMGGITPEQNVVGTLVVDRPRYPQQQRQQESADGAESHSEDVQAVAEVILN